MFHSYTSVVFVSQNVLWQLHAAPPAAASSPVQVHEGELLVSVPRQATIEVPLDDDLEDFVRTSRAAHRKKNSAQRTLKTRTPDAHSAAAQGLAVESP